MTDGAARVRLGIGAIRRDSENQAGSRSYRAPGVFAAGFKEKKLLRMGGIQETLESYIG